MWTIHNENGDIALSDIDDKTFISFWTHEEYVKSNLSLGWENCIPVKLSFEKLEKDILTLIEKENYLINVFPVNGKSGFIVSLNEFIRDLNVELEQYE